MGPLKDQAAYPSHFEQGTPRMKSFAEEVYRLFGYSFVAVTYLYYDTWYRCDAGLALPQASLENILHRSVMQTGKSVEVQDILNHPSYKFTVLKTGGPLIRYMSVHPIFGSKANVNGLVTMVDLRRKELGNDGVARLRKVAETVNSEFLAELGNRSVAKNPE